MTKKIRFLVKLRMTYWSIKHRLRFSNSLTALLGYAWKPNYKYVDLVITSDCNLKCYDCNMLCRQAPSKELMTVKQVENFVNESIANKYFWKRVAITGGEPTTHPDLLAIIKRLHKYLKHSPKTKFTLLTNGRNKSAVKTIPSWITVMSTNKKGTVHPWHRAVNNAPVDSKTYERANFSNGCFMLRYGITYCKKGYYPCSTACAIDRTMSIGTGQAKLKGLKENLRDSLNKSCKYCGFFMFKDFKKKPGYYSPTWKKALKEYKKSLG